MDKIDICEQCGHILTPIYFKAEYKNKWRYEVSYLLCEKCGSKIITDGDYKALEWHYDYKGE